MRPIRDIRRDNLRALIGRETQVAFAERILKDKNQVNQWLRDPKDARGRGISDATARHIEKRCGKPRGWMDHEHFEGVRDDPVAAFENRPGYVRLPLLDVGISAGTGASVESYEGEVVQYLDVAEWWAQQHIGRDLARIRVLTARGDSMMPDIQPGDVMFVDVGVQGFEAPGVYVLNWQGRALVKRLVPELRTGRLGLHSTNPAYPVEYVDPNEIDQLHISGRVAACWTLRRY